MDFVWGTSTVSAMTFSPALEERFESSLPAILLDGSDRLSFRCFCMHRTRLVTCSQELVEEVARRCGVTPLQVDEVIGYYSMLHRKPLGKYHVQVCTNIACQAVGARNLYEHASRSLN